MFIRFNYRCPDCGHEEERFVKKDQMDEQFCSHPEIDNSFASALMTRLPAAPRTTFRFHDNKLKR